MIEVSEFRIILGTMMIAIISFAIGYIWGRFGEESK